jgi:hypothetical protein
MMQKTKRNDSEDVDLPMIQKIAPVAPEKRRRIKEAPP